MSTRISRKTGAGRTPRRPRNAEATRQAILQSARLAFTRSGYDGVGVREIAQGAGVTAMLVNRYFGSKEQLFEEVVEVTLSAPGILTSQVTAGGRELATLSRNVADALVARTAPEATPMDGFLLMLRSAANESAAKILRRKFTTHFEKPLADILPGVRPSERAAMFLAIIAGFQVLRQVVGIPGLLDAEPAALSARLQVLFDVLMNEDPSSTA
ncbi:TetR/AcrR family transcriptional regulator [Hyalangium versicolor]|uniref:TetR/AcrR family transcriptional regulator n=1 Tax=Hyalangium versicolor TaxID=2861190 RepID=UPI001CCC4E57|nr:TetR/AcrR family transcriptional regulator [Hyalangium versicolor]